MPALPLEGVVVADLTRALSGPYCTALLADMGAEVIKIEGLPGGDTCREWSPFEGDRSLYFESTNRNKKSLAVDFYSEPGMRVIRSIIRRADVLVENFRPGTLEKMGLAEDVLRELNPHLISASVSGFGEVGPLRGYPGLDQIIQGMSGLTSVTGPDREHMYRVGVPIVDITSGMLCAFSIVSALVGRGSSHPVSRVSTSLLQAGLGLSVFQSQMALSLNTDPEPQGNSHPVISPYGVFATASVPITIAAASERQWRTLCGIIGAPELVEDARFANGSARLENKAELTRIIEGRMRSAEADHWVHELREGGVPAGPISTYTEAVRNPQADALGVVQTVSRGDGSEIPLLRSPLWVEGGPVDIRSAPPSFGEHTREVLSGIGLGEAEIDSLLETGAVKTS